MTGLISVICEPAINVCKQNTNAMVMNATLNAFKAYSCKSCLNKKTDCFTVVDSEQ